MAPEYQFLDASQRKQAGDTQALAPATEEQAHELDEAMRRQQVRVGRWGWAQACCIDSFSAATELGHLIKPMVHGWH